MALNTFKEVEAKYNSIKPVAGKLTKKEYDVRPIGSRRAKHNRICKIDDNCYAIMTESVITDAPERGRGGGYSKSAVAMSAPIVWRRDTNGVETVTIHNSMHAHAVGWYEFLRKHMPTGLRFDNSVIHKINVMGGLSFFLPKNKLDVSAQDGPSEIGLTFRRHDMNGRTFRWEQVGQNYEKDLRTASTFYIDKEEKAEFRKDIVKFREWAGAMLPLMSIPTEWQARRDFNKPLAETLKTLERELSGNDPLFKFRGKFWEDRYPNAFRHALKNEDSPARVPMLYVFLQYIEDYLDTGESIQNLEHKQLMSRMNDFINRACNFRKSHG